MAFGAACALPLQARSDTSPGGQRSASPTAEFEAPYAISVVPGGEIVEIAGSFSWAMPQNFSATLARTPHVRTIRFNSPGGHIQAAMQIADIIRARGLDTYVPGFCASACTVAFLAGKGRFLAQDARLGFHQAHAPGMAPETFDPMLRAIYEHAGLPGPFIDHVLHTPPASVWYPARSELQTAGITTAPAPDSVMALDDTATLAWHAALLLLPVVPDATVVSVAGLFSHMLQEIQDTQPESCWGYFHDMPTDLRRLLPAPLLETMTQAERHLHEDAGRAVPPPIDPAERAKVFQSLFEAARAQTDAAPLAALLPGGDHAGFCPALEWLLKTALALPEPERIRTLRALMVGG